MPYRILHVSDLHTGPPFREHVAAALIRQAHELRLDLLVISGDFVQRADFVAQWRAAQQLRSALPEPQLVVPGNHDVPLYHAHLRVLNPLGRYRRYISRELNPVFERPGLVVVGAVSAHGLTVDGGWVNASQARKLRAILGRYGPEVYKIVVWHHPVVNPPGIERNRVMTGAVRTMCLLDELEADLLLCGHVHVSYIGNTRDVVSDLRRGTLICQSGTTTSRRGHGSEHGKNSCNLIELDEGEVRVSQLLYSEATDRFEPMADFTFPRSGAPAPTQV